MKFTKVAGRVLDRVSSGKFWGEFFLTPLETNGDNGKYMENHHFYIDIFLFNIGDTLHVHGCFSIVMFVSGRVRTLHKTNW